MSGEPDSGTCATGGSIIKTAIRLEMEPPSNNNNNNNLTNNNNTMNNDDNDCDNDRVTGSSINYDSSDSIGRDTKVGILKLRCDRCDIFETQSRTLMIAHTAQCGISSQHQLGNQDQGGGGGPVVGSGSVLSNIVPLSLLKDEKSILFNNNNLVIKPENLQIRQSVQQQHASTTSSTTTTTTSSTTVNNNNNTTTNNNNIDPNKRKCFECDVCNMKFSNGANMRRHKMRHTGVKPYECRVCQKRFFRKDHLAEHFTTHTKTLPYHCPICNRGFQRQIAMRAHFQNEHVGQHDLVKTCPLCSYRAGTMKSLRVHFFNRHGIDLDNPGPGAPSSLLLALDPTNAGHLLPNLAAAAAAAQNYSDSGDSLRSTDNATPPMHFLTPHVEISMADNNENYVCEPTPPNSTSGLEIQPCPSTRPNGGSPSSPHSADSNSNAPSSSHSLIPAMVQSARHLLLETSITPSISLIPIKQEPASNDDYPDIKQVRSKESSQISPNASMNISSGDSSTPSSSLTSLIKVSPLKSLLREDLKRRISARANNRATRNSNNNNSSSSLSNNNNDNNNSTTSTNNNNSNSIINSSNSISNTLSVIAESSPTVATTSNGIITSTGAETTEMILASRRRNLQCLFCGIEFPDQTLYFLHKGCHSESNPWKCNICGEQCNNVYEFNSHLLSKSHQ